MERSMKMKFIYRLFGQCQSCLGCYFYTYWKYSINWIRNCLHFCRVFRCSISIDRNILCKTSKSWLYQWMFRDSMCGSKMRIGDMLDFFDRLCYRYLNVILDEFCSIFVLLYRTEMMYFHPMLILLGFHFYEVQTNEGTWVRIIQRGKIVRNAKYVVSDNLYRLSDYTYIEL